MLQPLGSSYPVPHCGARDGRRQDGEAEHDAEGHATLADALQAAGKQKSSSEVRQGRGLVLGVRTSDGQEP